MPIQFLLLLSTILLFSAHAIGEEWKVTEVPDTGRVVVSQGNGEPPGVADVVEFYFVIPGLNEKARRAEGTVESVSENTFTVTVNEATSTGKIAVGDKVALLRPATSKEKMKPSSKDTTTPPKPKVTPPEGKTEPKETATEIPKGEMKTPPPVKPVPPPTTESTSPRIRNVPGEYPTIQAAIDAAGKGDVVLIKSGVYTEFLRIRKGGIGITGEKGGIVIIRFPAVAIDQDTNLLQVFRDPGIPQDDKPPKILLSNLTFACPQGAVTAKIPGKMPIYGFGFSNGGEVTFSSCEFRGDGTIRGLETSSGLIKASRCEFEDCFIAVFCKGNQAEAVIDVQSCTINSSGISGIIISSAGKGFIGETTIKGSGEDGILVKNGGYGLITDCTLEGNKRNGIEFSYGSGGIATRNNCTKNGFNGILVTGKETVVRYVTWNRCISNSKAGIVFSAGARGMLGENECNENEFSGIQAEGAETKPSIVGNTCNNNKQNGIAVDRNCYPPEFRDNVAKGNGYGDINRNATFQ